MRIAYYLSIVCARKTIFIANPYFIPNQGATKILIAAKKRGVDVDPDRLRRELRLHGNNSATLLITPVTGRPAAIFAHRLL